MPTASEFTADDHVKLLFIGNSGAGKTGALAPLLGAGYRLRILDFDNGLRALINHAKELGADLNQIEYIQFRDRVKMTATGPRVVGTPKAYSDSLQALEKWPEDGSDPAEWGTDTILVVDSLTNVARAAFQWAQFASPTVKDPRQWYKTAQDLVENLIANLTNPAFHTHVIVISHVELVESNGVTRGYASSIGKALGPKLPRFFDTMLLSETKGSGKSVKRRILTAPTHQIDLKNPVPMKIEAEYPIETGLADIFTLLRATDE